MSLSNGKRRRLRELDGSGSDDDSRPMLSSEGCFSPNGAKVISRRMPKEHEDALAGIATKSSIELIPLLLSQYELSSVLLASLCHRVLSVPSQQYLLVKSYTTMRPRPGWLVYYARVS